MLNRRGIYLRGLVEEKGAPEVARILIEAFNDKGPDGLKMSDFSLLETAYGIMGPTWVANLANQHGGFHINAPLLEAGATDSTAFSNITGQIIYNATMDGYTNPAMIGDELVTVTPTNLLDGEKIAGITEPQGEPENVGEGMPYPRVNLAEDYIETPATTKRGLIVPVTKEAILKDRTGLILDRARMAGERIAMKREKNILDVVVGAVNNYKRKGTTGNTYLTSGAYINQQATNELLDWQQIEVLELLFAAMTNPDQTDDSEPVVYQPDTLIVTPYKRHTAIQIVGASTVQQRTPTGAVNLAQVRQTVNPVADYKVVCSPILQQRIVNSGVTAANAKNWWFCGKPKKAFRYMQVWPVTVAQAPVGHPDEFEKDVVLQYKASERGVCAVVEPRYMVKSYLA